MTCDSEGSRQSPRSATSAFEAEAANLFFRLVALRYEREGHLTTNKQFGRWGEVFGAVVADVPMIDRLVHHAEVVDDGDNAAFPLTPGRPGDVPLSLPHAIARAFFPPPPPS